MSKTEQVLNQIIELAQNATMASIDVGELASFTGEDGIDYVASVENYDDGIYTLRILAQAGTEFEPTDDVRKVEQSMVEKYNGNVQGAEETSDIQEDDDVEFESEDGDTKGVVIKAGEMCQVEVYSAFEGKYEPTGVIVEHKPSDLSKTSFVKAHVDNTLLVEIKDALATKNEDTGIIEGKLSSYGNVDLGGDMVQKGAYTQTLNHKNGKIKFFLDHFYGVKDLVGVAYLQDKQDGLYMKGNVPLESQTARDAFIKAKFMIEHGEPLGLSIGYDTIKAENMPDGTRLLKEIALHEASLTPFPMDTHALTLSAKARKIGYQAKKKRWQTLKSDASSDNRYTEGEITSLLSEIKTEILNKGI